MTTGELLIRAWGNTFTTGLPTNLALLAALGAVLVKWRRLRAGAAWCALGGFGLWLVMNFLHPLLIAIIFEPVDFDSYDLTGRTAKMLLLQWFSTAAYTLTFLLVLAAAVIGPKRQAPPPLPSTASLS